jgi:hypothetical protein
VLQIARGPFATHGDASHESNFGPSIPDLIPQANHGFDLKQNVAGCVEFRSYDVHLPWNLIFCARVPVTGRTGRCEAA